jgi:hypothetical protein
MEERITWAQLDPYGQIVGTPYTGDVEGLQKFARKDVADLAQFSRDDWFRYYHHLTGRAVYCTVVTMTLPWGSYRFIPVEATRLQPLKHPMGRGWLSKKRIR